MQKLKLKILFILASMPIYSIAIAASSKINELNSELQNENILNQLRVLRNNFLPSHKIETDLENALIRYQQMTLLNGEELKKSFETDLNTLIEKNILNLNDSGGIGGSPSDA